MADHDHGHSSDGSVHVHIHPTKLYAAILGALLFLTIVTVAVSYVDIDGMMAMGREVQGVGAWNLGVAVLVATMKATLVVLFFMHLKDDARFNALIFVGALLFIGVFLAYTMNDTSTRGETGDAFNGVQIDPETGLRAPGGIAGEIHGQELEPGLAREEAEAPAAAPAAAADPGATPAATDEAELSDEGAALAEEASGAEEMEDAAEAVADEIGEAVGAEPDVEPAEVAEEPEPAPAPAAAEGE